MSTMPKMRRCSPEIPNMRGLYRLAQWVSIQAVRPIAIPGLVGLLFSSYPLQADPLRPLADDVYQAVTGDSSVEDRSRWDTFFSTNDYVYGKEPAPFLKANIGLLPVGRALDIAAAEGRNAVFLAKKGFRAEAVDISEVALRKARRLAREQNVTIQTINSDLKTYVIKANTYDVILNIQFLERKLFPQIKKGLKSGGVIVFENYTEDQLSNPAGKTISKDFLLRKGELKEVFKDFKILFDRETNDGKEAVARFIAKKP